MQYFTQVLQVIYNNEFYNIGINNLEDLQLNII